MTFVTFALFCMLLNWLRIYLKCRRPGFDLWVGKIPGEGKGYPLQYSCLENSMDSPWCCKEVDTTEQLSLIFLVRTVKSILSKFRVYCTLLLQAPCYTLDLQNLFILDIWSFVLFDQYFLISSVPQPLVITFLLSASNSLTYF